MIKVFGVCGEPLNAGVLFVGPRQKAAWSPNGELSSALGCVVDWESAAHPSDPWPKDQAKAAREIWKMPPRKAVRRPAAPRRTY